MKKNNDVLRREGRIKFPNNTFIINVSLALNHAEPVGNFYGYNNKTFFTHLDLTESTLLFIKTGSSKINSIWFCPVRDVFYFQNKTKYLGHIEEHGELVIVRYIFEKEEDSIMYKNKIFNMLDEYNNMYKIHKNFNPEEVEIFPIIKMLNKMRREYYDEEDDFNFEMRLQSRILDFLKNIYYSEKEKKWKQISTKCKEKEK